MAIRRYGIIHSIDVLHVVSLDGVRCRLLLSVCSFPSKAMRKACLWGRTITHPESIGYCRALLRVCRFLGRAPRSFGREEEATTILFSDILNYVDFRKVVGRSAEFLKTEGRIIIVNLPGRGVREEFSENGLKKNEDPYHFLEERNLAIESKAFPCRYRGVTDESEEMIVLAARKRRAIKLGDAGGARTDRGHLTMPAWRCRARARQRRGRPGGSAR